MPDTQTANSPLRPYNSPEMTNYTQSIQNLMNELARLPGIGMRSAERIAFHLLKQNPQEAMKLADAIRDVKTRIRHCSVCYNLTEQDPCGICSDPSRDQGVVCGRDRVLVSGQPQTDRHVLTRRQRWPQVLALEHERDLAGAILRQLCIRG